MKETALFVGWGETHPGREHIAVKHFHEWGEKLETLKLEGLIEGFEHVLLAPHGGALDGFTLVYGEPEKLAMLLQREDMHRFEVRARQDHGHFSVIWAATGGRVPREVALVEEILPEYEREPALV